MSAELRSRITDLFWFLLTCCMVIISAYFLLQILVYVLLMCL